MRFKHETDQRDWDNQIPERFDVKQGNRLRSLVKWLDQFCVLVGWGEVTVTSYFRPTDADSYHSIYQAADLRTHDKPMAFKTMALLFDQIFKWAGTDLQVYAHKELWGKPEEHIHVAVKDGKIAR